MPRRLREEGYLPMKDPAPSVMTVDKRIREFMLYWSNILCEDPVHGSQLDVDMLRAIEGVQRKHTESEKKICLSCGHPIGDHLGFGPCVVRGSNMPSEPVRRVPSAFLLDPTTPATTAIPSLPCPECGNGPVVYEEGCMKCHLCGYTECG